MTEPLVEVVMPTVGRPSLTAALAPLLGRIPVVVVDDRPGTPGPLDLPDGVRVVRSGGRGPAAARNAGWHTSRATWVAFLDDDVRPPSTWVAALHRDLARCAPDVGGTQGRLVVPLPTDRRPTDWERSTAGLETAVWATADLAYRRQTLRQAGGFDGRFPRAYREDADLGLRVVAAGWRIARGTRQVEHPVRPADWTQSIRSQRGNADDVLMRALHGPRWRARAHVPPGRRRWHLATAASLLLSLGGAVVGSRRTALAGAAAWLALTADLVVRRVAPGPRTPAEVATMTATSAVLPLAAAAWWLTGWLRLPALLRQPGPVPDDGGGTAVRNSA
ncbi:MAG: glycosyltransferase family 2 protein [Mycobacteriales bacterium]